MLAAAVCLGVAAATPAAADSPWPDDTATSATSTAPTTSTTSATSTEDGPAWYGWDLRLTDDSIVTTETRSGFAGDTAYFSTEQWSLGPQGISTQYVASHS